MNDYSGPKRSSLPVRFLYRNAANPQMPPINNACKGRGQLGNSKRIPADGAKTTARPIDITSGFGIRSLLGRVLCVFWGKLPPALHLSSPFLTEVR